jgi:hypothetical protein
MLRGIYETVLKRLRKIYQITAEWLIEHSQERIGSSPD